MGPYKSGQVWFWAILLFLFWKYAKGFSGKKKKSGSRSITLVTLYQIIWNLYTRSGTIKGWPNFILYHIFHSGFAKKNPQKFSFICKSFEIHDSIYFSQYTEQFEFGFNNDSYGSSIIPLFFLSWKQGHPCPIVVFYLKKNRMAWRHAPFDKKKCGAMYCRCALFRFFKRSVRSLGRRATTLANYKILTPLWKFLKMPTADRRKRKREKLRKAEACQFLINIHRWWWCLPELGNLSTMFW